MKNKGIIGWLAVVFVTNSLLVTAQSTQPDTLTWKRQFNFTANLNQASFSSNWKGGGINSIGLNTLLNYRVGYREGRRSWDNDIDLAFAFVNNSGQGYRKTVDRIYLDTKFGYKLSENWGLFTALNFLTQFDEGFEYPEDGTRKLISDIFAPAFITSTWGFEYHPEPFFTLRISPFAPRITIVRNPERFVATVGPEPYGVVPGDNLRMEWLSSQLLAEFNKDIFTNVNLKWRYLLFANYDTLQARTLDHRLDVNILAKINRFFNVSFGGILLYDYDQDRDVQLSQAFSLGFVYSFKNYVDPKK